MKREPDLESEEPVQKAEAESQAAVVDYLDENENEELTFY